MDLTPGVDRSTTMRLPRTRGDGPYYAAYEQAVREASPHTRGWTHGIVGTRVGRGGFPAHAGMDPLMVAMGRSPMGLPRTRGDGPGDYYPGRYVKVASPHTRGWTRSG